MSGWTAAVLGLLLVINPPGVSRLAAWGNRSDPSWVRSTTVTVTGAGVVVLGLGLITGPLLSALSLSTPTFRLAASVVMGLAGGKWFLSPGEPVDHIAGDRDGALVLGTSVLTPGPVFAALAATGDAGTAAGAVSVVVAFGATLLMLLAPRLSDPTSAAATRFVGALTLALAIAVGLDSARSV